MNKNSKSAKNPKQLIKVRRCGRKHKDLMLIQRQNVQSLISNWNKKENRKLQRNKHWRFKNSKSWRYPNTYSFALPQG